MSKNLHYRSRINNIPQSNMTYVIAIDDTCLGRLLRMLQHILSPS